MLSAFPSPEWGPDALRLLLAVLAGMALPVLLRGLRPPRTGAPPHRHAPPVHEPGPHSPLPGPLERARDDLTAFRLEVARTYVPLSLIRDVDQRLTQHLMRIEQKLDEATRAAIVAAARVAAMEEDRK